MPTTPPSRPVHAFTWRANSLAKDIIAPCKVTLPHDPAKDGQSLPEAHETRALWDTGAQGCAITPALVKQVGLRPIGKAQVRGANDHRIQNVYLLNILFSDRLLVTSVRATECSDVAGAFGLIIGMSVITLGDFTISNVEGKTTVSYRIPSIEEVDYVQDAQQRPAPVVTGKKIGRNDRVIIHKPGEDVAAKLKRKYAQKKMDEEDGWEMIGPVDG